MWLLHLALFTAAGWQIDAGYLHNKHGLVRFSTEAECREMVVAMQFLANMQAASGKLNPRIKRAEFDCVKPIAA